MLVVRSSLVAVLSLFLSLAVGCTSEDDFLSPDDESADSGCERVDYEFLPEESTSTERIHHLNQYATTKLASKQCSVVNTLTKRGLPEPVAVDQAYSLEIGSYDHCFNDGFVFADFDLDSRERYEDMKEQVDFAAEFLAKLHEDADGRPVPFMDTVQICPKEAFGEEFSLVGSRLYVNVDFEQLIGRSFQTYDARELLDRWDDGDHLHDHSDKIQLAWPFINPTGTFRTSMRRGTLKSLMGLGGKLLGIADKLGGEGRARTAAGDPRRELRDLVREHVSHNYEVAEHGPIHDLALAAIGQATDEQLSCIVDEWHREVSDPVVGSMADQAGIAAMQNHTRSLDVDVLVIGVLNYANSHFITVNLGTWFADGYQDLVPYIETVEPNQKSVDITLIGAGLGYTLDDVDVNVEFHINKAVQTRGIEYALAECMDQVLLPQ